MCTLHRTWQPTFVCYAKLYGNILFGWKREKKEEEGDKGGGGGGGYREIWLLRKIHSSL